MTWNHVRFFLCNHSLAEFDWGSTSSLSISLTAFVTGHGDRLWYKYIIYRGNQVLCHTVLLGVKDLADASEIEYQKHENSLVYDVRRKTWLPMNFEPGDKFESQWCLST